MNGKAAKRIRRAVPAGDKWKRRVKHAKRAWKKLSHKEKRHLKDAV